MSGETVLLASRSRFLQFHAGMVEVKMQGSGPRSTPSAAEGEGEESE